MAMLSRTIVRNSAVVMAVSMAMKVISFAFSVLIVRHLGAEEFGQYAAVTAFGTLFLFVGDLGLSPYLVREVARVRDAADSAARAGELYGTVLALRLLLSLLGITMMLVAAWATGRPLLMIGALALNGITFLLYAVQGTSEALLSGYERLDLAAGAKLVYQIAFVVLGAAVLALGLGYYGLILGTIAAVALLTSVCWRAARRLGVRPSAATLRSWPKLLRASLPFGVVAFTLGISYKFDSVLLNITHGDVSTGYYNAAYSLVFSTIVFSNAINTSLYPSLTRQATADPRALPAVYSRVLRYLIMIGLPIAFGVSILADQIVPFLFGAGYEPAIPALRIIIWAVPLMYVTEFLGYIVVISGREALVAKSILLSTACNIGLNLLAVPGYGFIGAAAITVATEAVLMTQYLWLLRPELRGLPAGRLLLRPVLAAALMGLALITLPTLPLLVSVALGGLSYAAALVGFGGLGREEWLFVRSLRGPAEPSTAR